MGVGRARRGLYKDGLLGWRGVMFSIRLMKSGTVLRNYCLTAVHDYYSTASAA